MTTVTFKSICHLDLECHIRKKIESCVRSRVTDSKPNMSVSCACGQKSTLSSTCVQRIMHCGVCMCVCVLFFFLRRSYFWHFF